MQKSWLIAACALVAIAFQNCSGAGTSSIASQGTFTGNAEAPAEVAASLVAAACSKLNACQPSADTDACASALGNASPASLGVSVSTGLTNFSKLESAEDGGTLANVGLQSNSSAMLACSSEISQISCSSSVITGAETSSFTGLAEIFTLGTDCAKVYSATAQ